MPDDIGFLPCPSGQWLVTWEVSSQTRYGEPEQTQWKLVRVQDGQVVQIGAQPGPVGLLPRWTSDTQLVLAGKGGVETLVDVSTIGQAVLPPPIPPDDYSQTARTEYQRRYYQSEYDALSAALQRSQDELGLREFHGFLKRLEGDERKDAVSDMVLWPLGIPHLDTLSHLPIRRPEVAFSPDGTLLALADAWTDAPAITVRHGGEETTVHAAGARLVVYRASSGEPVWTQEDPPIPRKLTEQGPRVNPSPMPWVSPCYTDPRWSRDGHYLSFTRYDYSGVPTVYVVETRSWRQVAGVPGTFDAFIAPVAPAQADRP